jgi:uroporphyrin-III C-methyltransferase
VDKYRPQINWKALAKASETLVIYMGVHNLSNIIPQLVSGGMPLNTPIALIRWGTRPDQEELIGNLNTIMEQIETTNFSAPAIAVIGKVVDLRLNQ